MSLPLILNQTSYVADLIEQINHPECAEVWIQAMVFSPRGDQLEPLMEALHGLLQRGGKATIVTDYYNHLRPEDYEPNNHLHEPFYLQEVKNIFENYRNTRATFMKAGGVWYETNPPNALTSIVDIWGRNHMKSAGILRKNGEKMLYLGGCNIYPHAMSFIDFMTRFDDAEMYDKVRNVIDLALQGKTPPNQILSGANDYDIYIDSGHFPGNSLIYKTALEMIRQPGLLSLYITCQFSLDPIVQHALEQQAKRGVNVHVFIPTMEHTLVMQEGIGRWLYDAMVNAEKKIPSYYLYHSSGRKVHAKLLVTESKTGTIETFWGSNNYFFLGPLLCTPEIQARSRNQEFNHILRDYFWNLVEGSA